MLILIIVTVFITADDDPLTVNTDEIRRIAHSQAKEDSSPMIWYAAGCSLSFWGIFGAMIIEPSPPVAELIGKSPDYIIPTHPHSDHITGLPGLMEKYPEANIITANGAKEFIEHPKADQLLIKEDIFLHKSIAQRGIIPGREPLKVMPNLKDSLIVEKKESLDLGNITLDLIKVDATLKVADLINQDTYSDHDLVEKFFKYYYVDEFMIYTESNIRNCMMLLIKRAKESKDIS